MTEFILYFLLVLLFIRRLKCFVAGIRPCRVTSRSVSCVDDIFIPYQHDTSQSNAGYCDYCGQPHLHKKGDSCPHCGAR